MSTEQGGVRVFSDITHKLCFAGSPYYLGMGFTNTPLFVCSTIFVPFLAKFKLSNQKNLSKIIRMSGSEKSCKDFLRFSRNN